jgi:hypothetical protein
MKKDFVIELIEDNRLKEALDELKKATKGTHLYNQVILLSANYEDNLKLEITGMEDYSVRSQKHAQLVNALLLMTDKVVEHEPKPSPIPLPNIQMPQMGVKQLKMIGIGLGLAVMLVGMVYFVKTTDWQSLEPTKKPLPALFNLEIMVVKNEGEGIYTEGGKIKVKIGGEAPKTLILNAEGKQYLTDLPIVLKDKNLNVQFEDTSFYSLMNPVITESESTKTWKGVAKMQTMPFSGRLVRFDMQPVPNAVLDFGNGKAKATTDVAGAYTVNLPKNIGEDIELTIIENGKAVFSKKILVNEKVLSLLKVY